MPQRDLTTIDAGGRAETFDSGFRTSAEKVEIGQWYWVSTTVSYDGAWTDDDGNDLKKGAKVEWLGCVMKIGTNFVELHSPPKGHSGSMTTRVHFDEFEKRLRFEPDADAHIKGRIAFYQHQVNTLLGQVQEVTQRLGVVPKQQIVDHNTGEGQNALAVISTQVDTDEYKNALVTAKEETLPELFEKIEEAHKDLASWMIAPTMPVKATIGPMKDSIGAIEERIYTIELYAGLTEEAVQCRDGEAAEFGEKLRVMQRRLYMDEECLANYQAGGMEIKDIRKFDEWISNSENRDRILPFPRTLVAFRVRRSEKEREDEGHVWRMMVNIQLAKADKKTFLYVRNGEQVWRIDCDFEFDEMIIPNKEDFDPSEPMMVKMFGSRVDDMMPRKRWESLRKEEDEEGRKYKAWEKANPGESWIRNPHHNSVGFRYELKDYKPFDPSNVYFDDALAEIEAKIKEYNRIAVIIQGLFDRSLVLHPHPPVRVWDPLSFERAVELVYDARTLTHGEAPDFEAYRAELNKSITADSIVTGQEDYWLRREADRENERQERDWRTDRRTRSNYTRYRPYDDKGPGFVSRMDEWKPRVRKAVFRWTTESRSWRNDDLVRRTVTVPANELLNVSAYKPGDFKRFFADPRTRTDYLKWAPLMLAAEDYHAGKIELGGNSEAGTTWTS
jgi:hypothetical protein